VVPRRSVHLCFRLALTRIREGTLIVLANVTFANGLTLLSTQFAVRWRCSGEEFSDLQPVVDKI